MLSTIYIRLYFMRSYIVTTLTLPIDPLTSIVMIRIICKKSLEVKDEAFSLIVIQQ